MSPFIGSRIDDEQYMERLNRKADESDCESATEPQPNNGGQVDIERLDDHVESLDNIATDQTPLRVFWNGLMLEQ
ncbi:hypothetical protein [Pseudomonas sp. DWRC2-2]|uniref:hypothetical protein n=1 Tax=Pseudomonas sp. DWRC2-2 TaxID=2804567 RepID=UPI003CE93EB3